MTFCNNIFITKFNLTDRSVYIIFDWKPNDNDLFYAKVFDGDSAWSGSFSNKCVRENCERLEEPEGVYCNTVQKVLRNISEEFIYVCPAVDGETNSTKFSWKKIIQKDVLLHGSFMVKRNNELEPKDSMIDLLLIENNKLKSEMEEYHRSTNKLNDKLKKYKCIVEELSNTKDLLEATLYGKFVQVLNAKKGMIESLEEQLRILNFSDTE